MRFANAILAVVMWASPAVAQIPPQLRSAGVTQSQWTEAQEVISAQAQVLGFREDALRTLAIEIFEAQPGQSFQTYVELIREGAQRLPQALAAARALNPRGDETLADLQRRAVAAAEAGRLREALAIQDEYAALFQRAVQRAMEQPMRELAASYAAAADTAYTLGDYIGAAQRFGQAAATVPRTWIREYWFYLSAQATALQRRGELFVEPHNLEEARRLIEDVLLAEISRDSDPIVWADGQSELGVLFFRQDEYGVAGALERAAAAHERAAAVFTRDTNPYYWAREQGRIGNIYLRLGERGSPEAFDRAIAAYEAAGSVFTRTVEPARWADMQQNLGNVLHVRARRGEHEFIDSAFAALNSAHEVYTRDAYPRDWAGVHIILGNLYSFQGELGAPDAFERALASYEAALTVQTRETDPAGWAMIQSNLGATYFLQGVHKVPGAFDRSITAYEASLTVRRRDADVRGWADVTYNLANTYEAIERFADARIAAQGSLEVYEHLGDAHGAGLSRDLLARLPAQ